MTAPKELHLGEAPKRIPRGQWHTQTAFGDDCRFISRGGPDRGELLADRG